MMCDKCVVPAIDGKRRCLEAGDALGRLHRLGVIIESSRDHLPEQCRPVPRHRFHQQCAVEEFVAFFAAGFGNEQAAVAGGAVHQTVIVVGGRFVVGADRVVNST
jgi:hypothetical protein